MIETITSDYNTGLKLLERINESKVVKHSQQASYIHGYQQVIFLYSDENERVKHESDMILRGWSKLEVQNYACIYSNLHEKRELRIPCNIYERYLPKISLIIED